jgi:hypothetical protein
MNKTSTSEAGRERAMVRHILLYRPRPGTAAETLASAIAAFRGMAGKIEGLVGFEYGTNNSSQGLNHGLTHVVTLTFESVAARDAYLHHPEHQNFNDWVRALNLLDEVLVFDYVTRS